jgi:transcriptional regulator with XRE-family HTH domain
VTTRRPGRLQRIAHDATPLNAKQPDIDARIGWLLAMSRLHHKDEEFGDGRRFVTALEDAGCKASRSLVSRWESGDIPISYEGMAAYEQALGLPAGQLSSITGYIRSSIPGVKARVIRPQLDPASHEFTDRLDELIEKAEDGHASGIDWLDLGWHLASIPHVHLRKETWEGLADGVIRANPRSIRVAYRLYSTAAANIATIPRAQDYLGEAIDRYLSVPGVQVTVNPLGLLDRLPTRRAAELTLRTIEHPKSPGEFSVAVWLATMKVARGDFTAEERGRLDMIVLRHWRRNPAMAGEDLAELIAGLPEGMRSTLTTAANRAGRKKLGYSVEYAEDLVAAKAQALAEMIAAGARGRAPQTPAYDQDRLLPRMVREALFHRDSERRHVASLLISASPFAAGVTDELLTLLEDAGHRPWIRGRAATTVRYLSADRHRMRMARFLDDPNPDVVMQITQALGHLSYDDVSDQVLRSSLKKQYDATGRATLYALGMTGSPGLKAIVRSPGSPDWQKVAAQWWLETGPAIRA